MRAYSTQKTGKQKRLLMTANFRKNKKYRKCGCQIIVDKKEKARM